MEEHGLFAGKVLWVDLTEGGVKEEPLNYDLAQKYIGGWGMNARLAHDLIPAGMDAYDPEMPLIFGAGLLSGTPSPGSPKGFLTTKDAASGTVYTAVGSLLFATALKWAGYDHMVIKGKADKPVYLRVEDEDVEICDAGEFWGRDVRETMAALKKTP